MPHGGTHPFPYSPFRACADIKATIRPTNDFRVLGVQGLLIDEIETEFYGILPDSATKSAVSADLVTTFKDLWEILQSNKDSLHLAGTTEEIFDSYWKTLMTETSFPLAGTKEHGACSAAAAWAKLYSGSKDKHPQIAGVHAECPQASWRQYRHRMNLNAVRRKFIITKAGRMGWTPDTAQRGDPIFILKGGCVPFILRSASAANEVHSCPTYILVGESYVHGLMHGEYFTHLAPSSADVKWQDIDLI